MRSLADSSHDRYFVVYLTLGAFLALRSFVKICPSANMNTTPTRQTMLPTKATMIWTYIGG